MGATIKTSLTISKSLYVQAEGLARHLGISQDRLFETALADFINHSQNQVLITEIDPLAPDTNPAAADSQARTVVNQGDIYWVLLADSNSAEAGIRHPHVIIQEDVFNHSRLTTVVACALTSNLKRASLPGNVLLDGGEANLIRQSVVEVSKVSTVDKSHLGEYIGSLGAERVKQILAGMRFLQLSFFSR